MNKRTSTFRGLDGPHFPTGIDQLNNLYVTLSPDNEDLSAIGKQMEGWRMLHQLPDSEDDTRWYAAMDFVFRDRTEVFVAFPFPSQKDVSIAFYFKGADPKRVSALISDLTSRIAARNGAAAIT